MTTSSPSRNSVSPAGSRPVMPWRRMAVKATSAPCTRTSSSRRPTAQACGGSTTERSSSAGSVFCSSRAAAGCVRKVA
jgi:hypothetical protein